MPPASLMSTRAFGRPFATPAAAASLDSPRAIARATSRAWLASASEVTPNPIAHSIIAVITTSTGTAIAVSSTALPRSSRPKSRKGPEGLGALPSGLE